MIVASVLFACVALVADPVQIRVESEPAPLSGIVLGAHEQGIDFRRADDQTVLIPWFDLTPGTFPSSVDQQYKARALAAWRAHARIDRGDVYGALPIYRSLASTYLWGVGPQSVDVCEGLLTCYLESGQRREAVTPMLALIHATESDTSGMVPTSLIDQAFKVRKDLPPVFEDGVRPTLDIEDGVSIRVRLISSYYELVLSPPSDRERIVREIEELKRTQRARDAGLVLLEQMCFAQSHPEASSRQGARDSLRRRTQTQRGNWIEVWSRLSLGASLIRDDDPRVRDSGVIELIHIVVRLSDVDPQLTLLAADLADTYLSQTYRSEWGSAIIREAQQKIQMIRTQTVPAGDQSL